MINAKDLNKDNSSNKKENENLNQVNLKEKNILTVDLTHEEKIVYSQLGINPLIKLGKEYLNSNNFAQLHENSKKKEIVDKYDLKIEVGGGVRSIDSIKKYVDLGLEKVI